MFNKDGIIKYVGFKSGDSYAAGLKRIEIVYNVSIDDDYQKDKCETLLNQLEKDKRSEQFNKTEKKRRSDMLSHLKKYIEFKNNISVINQRDRFIEWLQNQPMAEDNSKKYSFATINAAVNKLQTGLRTLGIRKYMYTNCFAITSLNIFSQIYKECYVAAKEQDQKQGHRDFRNGLDFYKQFLEQNNTSENADPVREKIRFIINKYKENFDQIDKEEHYKWVAIAWYKQHWNINAPEFGKMVKTAFEKANNLLTSNMYFAYKMLTIFAEEEPEKIRELFRVLHNESLTFEQRFETFTKGFNDCIANRNKQTGQNSVHYQDLHAVTIYLFFEYPEKYFGYKATMYTKMRDRIGFVETKSKQKNKTGKFENYTQMCELVLSEINADDELKKLSSSRLDDNCYKDEAYHLLTVDIIYYGGMKMEDADFKEETSQTEVINQLEESTTDSNDIVFDVPVTDVELNTILYGPPGTGKTYNTVIYAVAIIENKKLSQVEAEDYEQVFKRYNEYKKSGRVAFTTFHQSYGYEEFIEGIKPVIETDNESGGNSEIKYSVVPGIFKAFCENASGIKKPTISEINDLNELNQATKSEIKENFVFILDEINRGNISKIFGELITLIEPSKRIGADEEIEVLLPYSAKLFGIPNNIYIIGTMNTADRSIATIDTALRRRFYFKEMLPKPEVLKDVYVEDLSIGDMLARINKRITVLYDREHTIGHAYFMALKESPTIDTLARIFENNIIPLLQEYFYEDYEKIRLVLGDNQKDEQSQFIIAKPNNYIELFGNQDVDFDEGYNYEINKTAFDNVEAYRSI